MDAFGSPNFHVFAFVLVLALGLFLPMRALAQEQGTYGQVGLIDGANESGFAFRLVGQPDLCTGGGTLRGYGTVRLQRVG